MAFEAFAQERSCVIEQEPFFQCVSWLPQHKYEGFLTAAWYEGGLLNCGLCLPSKKGNLDSGVLPSIFQCWRGYWSMYQQTSFWWKQVRIHDNRFCSGPRALSDWLHPHPPFAWSVGGLRLANALSWTKSQTHCKCCPCMNAWVLASEAFSQVRQNDWLRPRPIKGRSRATSPAAGRTRKSNAPNGGVQQTRVTCPQYMPDESGTSMWMETACGCGGRTRHVYFTCVLRFPRTDYRGGKGNSSTGHVKIKRCWTSSMIDALLSLSGRSFTLSLRTHSMMIWRMTFPLQVAASTTGWAVGGTWLESGAELSARVTGGRRGIPESVTSSSWGTTPPTDTSVRGLWETPGGGAISVEIGQVPLRQITQFSVIFGKVS